MQSVVQLYNVWRYISVIIMKRDIVFSWEGCPFYLGVVFFLCEGCPFHLGVVFHCSRGGPFWGVVFYWGVHLFYF